MSVCDEDVKIGGNGGPAGWLWGSDTMTHGPSYNSIFVLTCKYKHNFSSQFLPNFRKCRISKKYGRDRRERWDGREIRDKGNRRGDSGNWNWRDREGQRGDKWKRRGTRGT